jgi:pyruvate dehydrogenase E2 component (dihydrolipoamide acetyltransferase)
MFRVTIPQIFENMEEATLGHWIKAEGETVAAGEALCELITEKTTLDLPAEASGVLLSIVAPDKSIVPVGAIIAVLGEPGEELPDIAAENAAILARAAAKKPASGPPAVAPAISSRPVANLGSRLRATPAARRLARELKVDLEAVAQALPGKVLSEEDVRSFAQSGA